MRTIVFIGSNKSGSSREAILAAERLGYYTVLFTDRRSLLRRREEMPDVHKLIYVPLDDRRQIESQIDSLLESGKEIDAIVSFVDPYVSLAIQLAEKYCQSRLSQKVSEVMEDKSRTRFALSNTNYNPFFVVYDGTEPLDMVASELRDRFPLVVKVPSSTGSKDVRRAFTPQQFIERTTSLLHKYPHQPLLIEEYLSGKQYLVETLVQDKNITIVAVIKQHILRRRGYMIVDGYAVLVDTQTELFQSLRETVTSIIQSLALKNGPCHLELKRANHEWKLIEANPRISGGAMNRMIEVAYGVNLAEETLKLIVGQQPDLTPKHQRHVYTQYVTTAHPGVVRRVIGRSLAYQVPGVEHIYVKPRKGQKVVPPSSMGHRYAYVIAADDHSLDSAKAAAKCAAAKIKFQLH